jgi:hypothetical protein
MGNGRAKKPSFPGIDPGANAQSDAPEAWQSGAIPARAHESPRNHCQRRDELYDPRKRKRSSR